MSDKKRRPKWPFPAAPLDTVDDLPTSSRAAEVRTAVRMADKADRLRREAEAERNEAQDALIEAHERLDRVGVNRVHEDHTRLLTVAERIDRAVSP